MTFSGASAFTGPATLGVEWHSSKPLAGSCITCVPLDRLLGLSHSAASSLKQILERVVIPLANPMQDSLGAGSP
jgi:hypothetical protein